MSVDKWEVRCVPPDPAMLEKLKGALRPVTPMDQVRRAMREAGARRCSFCEKSQREVRKMVERAEAPYCCICDECLGLAAEKMGYRLEPDAEAESPPAP